MYPIQPSAAGPGNEQDKAWRSFFNKHYTRLCMVAYKITGNQVTAEEIVSATLDDYWPLQDNFATTTDFSQKLYSVVYYRSLIRRKLRIKISLAEKHYTDLISEADIAGIERAAKLALQVEAVLAALKKLPPGYQTVLRQHYLEEKKIMKVVAATGRTQSTVSTLKTKGLQLLRRLLLKGNPDNPAKKS